jgi:hypothetical protein
MAAVSVCQKVAAVHIIVSFDRQFSLSVRNAFQTSLTGDGIAAVCLENTNWWQNNRIIV